MNTSKLPTVKTHSWLLSTLQILVLASIIGVWFLVNPEKAMLYGALTYLVFSFSLRNLVPKSHRNGIRKMSQDNFMGAIEDFKNSYLFFDNNEWVDKFRVITMFSPSAMSYKEMAINNIAFCYGQLGDGQKSKEYYEKYLSEYPNSGLAKAALRLLNSVKNE